MAVYRQTVLDAQATAGTAVTTQRGVITTVGAGALEHMEELLVYLDVTTAVTGGALNMFLQRALVPNPVAATDAHWVDLVAFNQVAAGATAQLYTILPLREWGLVGTGGTVATRAVERATLTAVAAIVGHWGDQMRIVEKVGAGVTVAGVYSVHITGIDNA